MLPDDLPDNVIPFHPRRNRVRGRVASSDPETGKADPVALRPPGTGAGVGAPASSPSAAKNQQEAAVCCGISDSPPPSPAHMPSLPIRSSGFKATDVKANEVPARGIDPVSPPPLARAAPETSAAALETGRQDEGKTPHHSWTAGNDHAGPRVSSRAASPAAALSDRCMEPAMTAGRLPPEQTTDPVTRSAAMEMESTMPIKPRNAGVTRFSWRRMIWILAGSFLLGILIAWVAIAVGAHIIGVWPHGFALYAMLVGGGATMLLTSALMSAVFYSDTSGHDDEVQRMQSRRQSKDVASDEALEKRDQPPP